MEQMLRNRIVALGAFDRPRRKGATDGLSMLVLLEHFLAEPDARDLAEVGDSEFRSLRALKSRGRNKDAQ